MKHTSFVLIIAVILAATLVVAVDVSPVRASGTIYIRADGSIDPPTAPISTLDNVTYTFTDNIYDSIVVERNNIELHGDGYTLEGTGSGTGIYLSGRTNVTIKKIHVTNFNYGIWLQSSDNNNISDNTITANNEYGIFLRPNSDYNNISGNTITANLLFGVFLWEGSSYNIIGGNNITANGNVGIYLAWETRYNNVSGNVIANNYHGLLLGNSHNNHISGNTFTNNGLYNGAGVWASYGNLVEDNTVNGKPLVYLEDVADYSVADAGQVILVSCTGVRVESLNLSRASVGVQLINTTNSVIEGNTITDNALGITSLRFSTNNTVSSNTIANNVNGIHLASSSYNIFCHNDFINNTLQVYDGAWDYPEYHLPSVNDWDDGYPSGGNYWDDYVGEDEYSGLNQDEPGSDGIGDTPYVIDAHNEDSYPLMYPYSPPPYDIAVTTVTPSKTIVGQGYTMHINVTVANLGDFTETFNVTVYANTTEIETRETTLLSGASTTMTFTWNTTGFAYGNYTISAYAWPVDGETLVNDNTGVDGWVLVTIPGDVDGDRDVDIFDIVLLGGGYGTVEGHPDFNANCDIDGDGDIDIFDLVLAASHYGDRW